MYSRKGMRTFQIGISGRILPFESIVLPDCSHGIILGWNFLKVSGALIDCGRSEFTLDDVKVISEEIVFKPLRLRGKTEIWVVNGQSQEKVSPQGMCVAFAELFCPDCIATISETSRVPTEISETKQSFEFLKMISPDLDANQKRMLVDVLQEYSEPANQDLGASRVRRGYNARPGKVRAVQNFTAPKNIHDVRSFSELCSYYRRFIKDFCLKAQPLQELLKNDSKFTWGSDQKESFEKLKTALTSKPVLGLFDEKALTELHADTSGLKDPSGRLSRWALRFQEYDLEIVYKSRKKHKDADSLSRNPAEDEVFSSE
ncbi:transposon Ty3-I Gag-Pol polyprotein [Trichonephila inaurata madagascariensis]|uniref:RNA-directed DNA polymerase n=1 Tax=Trichonephila inaurata madagascariensis TaxID=2747483 RepID=A0A8X6IDN5_9ARAC|nr:transposon Ty3-I Gag-Pol polyprotein [Trichonephila inaurata madagascariensis]